MLRALSEANKDRAWMSRLQILSPLYGDPDSAGTRSIVEGIEGEKLAKREQYDLFCTALEELYYGRAYDITWQYLKTYYPSSASITSEDGSYQLTPWLYPIVRKVINTLATSFLATPEIHWTKDGVRVEASEQQDRAWAHVARKSKWKRALAQADAFAAMFDAAFLQVAYRDDRVDIDVLGPHRVHAYGGAPRPWDIQDASRVCIDATGFVSNVKTSDIKPLDYIRWTPSAVEAVGYNGIVYPDAIFPGGKNPYGIVPFAVWHNDQQYTLYPDPDQTLFWAQVNINLIITDANNGIRKGIYGQRWIKSDAGTIKTSDVPSGPDTVWMLGGSAEIGSDSPNANVYQIMLWVRGMLAHVAASMDLPVDVFENTASALAQMVQRWDLTLQRLRNDNIRDQQASDLYGIIARVHNQHQTDRAMVLDEDLEMVVTTVAPPRPEDSLHTAQAAEAWVRLGVESPVDIIAKREGITREQARARFEANIDDRKYTIQAAPSESAPEVIDLEDSGGTE